MKLLAGLVQAAMASVVVIGCGPDGHSLLSQGPGDIPGGGADASKSLACGTPQEGCACEQDRQVIDCGQVERRSAGYVSCSLGKRTCKDGAWGACIGDRISGNIPTGGSAKGLLTLGQAAPCIDNPCDPYCVKYVDDGSGLDGGSTLVLVDGGLSLLEGVATPATTTCTGMSVSPTPQSLTVTGVSPLVTTPASLQFTVQLTPPGCANTTIPATWVVSDNDISAITPTGLFTAYAPVAAPVSLTAYVATWQASALATILVDIRDTTQAPPGTDTAFTGPTGAADVMTILYPYANTVFPRALASPLLQWDNGGQPADAVKISLRYPATGTPTFSWWSIIPEPAAPQATLPQEVWTAFDQTAKAQDALFVIQRIVGGVLMQEQSRTIHFSSTPLRGLIYYTEYGRLPSNPLPTPPVGGVCKPPGGPASIRALDPTVKTPPINPFAVIAPGGCPVCHSVSANGHMFVTSQRTWSAGGGVSRINADGSFTQISDSPQPPVMGTDSRGFAFAALTPDGTYALQGSNLWGNTVQPGGTGTGFRKSAGSGTGLQGDYYANNSLSGSPAASQIDQTVNFSWPSGSTPDPLVSSNGDDFSVRWTGQVQSYGTETITFYVESDEGVRLWVNGVQLIDNWVDQTDTEKSGTIALVTGVKYDIKLEYYERTGDALVKLSWSSPTTAKEVIPVTQFYPPAQPTSINGLTASYYDQSVGQGGGAIDFGGTTVTRIDKTVNFNWGSCATAGICSPDPAIATTYFTARWIGQVQAAYNETYTFATSSDDGVRLWVNGTLLVNKWVGQGANASCPPGAGYFGTVAMTAGTKYPIKLEYFNGTGSASVKLFWSSPSTPCAIIPNNRLFQ